ncbi:MAG TPA: ABC transporter substrate-binding protein [Stellaceae bacterium]|nr:ABC transporter substrate-binding protein [Stellaceae bacterium]
MQRRDFIKLTSVTAGLVAAGQSWPVLAQGVAKDVLNVAINPEPPGLMIAIIQNGPTQLVSGNIYEGLLRYDEALKPMPGLASAWKVSDDALTYTFTLKPGVTWHDGKPFSSADVVFSVDKLLREVHARLRASLGAVDSITAPDDDTVVFKLKYPFGPFLGLFEVGTMPIAPKHIYDGTDYRTNPANNTPIGTGPYKFTEWKRGEYIRLDKNEAFHEPGLPTIKTIYFQVIPDAASRAAGYETGKMDVMPGGSVEYFDIARLKALPKTEVTTKGWEFFGPLSMLCINNRNAPLNDPRMRRAIMYAMDRQAIKNVAWSGFGKVATGPFHSSTRFHTDAVTPYPHDKAKAKALLTEVGYAGQTIRLLPLPYGETWQRVAEITRQNLGEVGIKVDMQATDVPGWNEKLNNWDYDLAFNYLYQYGDPALGVARNYTTANIAKGSPFNNVSGYSNPKIDELFDSGAREPDEKRRAAIYAEAQKILVDDVAVAWLMELEFPTIYRSNVTNLVNSGIGLNDGFARAKIT